MINNNNNKWLIYGSDFKVLSVNLCVLNPGDINCSVCVTGGRLPVSRGLVQWPLEPLQVPEEPNQQRHTFKVHTNETTHKHTRSWLDEVVES